MESHDHDLNLKATELRLGLPGSDDEPEKQTTSSVRSNKRASTEISQESNSVSDDHERCAPPSKAQVVGWPPIRSYRKNTTLQAKNKNESEIGAGIYVKVSVDGAPYLRKIDLKVYKCYPELLEALENMFKLTIGYNGSNYAPTYQDKDGDWMLVGDVPFHMFITSCKRLRIMRGSEARGLGSCV